MRAETIIGALAVLAFLGLFIWVMVLAVRGEELAVATADDMALERAALEHRKAKALRIANGGGR
jgi:uncharacterized membrane protein